MVFCEISDHTFIKEYLLLETYEIWLGRSAKKKRNGDIVKTDRYLISYVKQIEFYQWLFRMNGFQVSSTAYFVFANAQKERECFDDRLDFEKVLMPHVGDDSWVEPTLLEIVECLRSDTVPAFDHECDYCSYVHAASFHGSSSEGIV